MKFHDRVSVTIEDHVAHVLLDRADKMNALDDAMFEGIVAAGSHLHTAKGVRSVVLSGAGRSFCAGLDLSSMGNTDRWGSGGSLTDRTHGNANRAQQAAMVWRKLPMPVIAAVHGVCFGGGLQVMSGADIRIVAPDARLAVMEVKWGLVPDMGGYALWRGNVRDDVLRELTYTHREFNGTEAAALGFATHADADPLGRAMALAKEIASKSPHAVRGAKLLTNRTVYMDEDAILMAESVAQHELMYSRNQIEAVKAGMEKRVADFVDP
ncbi:MAG: crotonase/enoyl-CoA hydratase family protein [Sphingomonadales bacterium]|jgi:enoyl-CoA hydratase/carnithine racemase|uniref:crotonase/enoyl-CoA hydratase family protein n=1 Tax=Novosphingobium sp. NDB2Meth1 TaxID=1892847 RepID=UPI000930B03F|nr:crotonase/enoyl-CoA hydratase family protein [Novosphingobium sp. NDB2Meth1]MBU6394838.1 crotonase/enoyl-CoA hydratase family protein [Sphingomonadales bacterium]